MTKKWLAVATGVVVGATGWGVAATSVAAHPSAAHPSAAGAHAVAGSTGSVKVKIRHVSPYGAILTNRAGRSLYLFSRDTKGHSHCTGACAQEWLPLLVGKGKTVSGVSGLGTIKRGSKRQVALHGKPLYTFAGDVAPGQVNGQGVEGSWFVATPVGPGRATAPTPTSTPAPTPTPTITQTQPDPGSTPTPSDPNPPAPPTTAPATSPPSGGYGY